MNDAVFMEEMEAKGDVERDPPAPTHTTCARMSTCPLLS